MEDYLKKNGRRPQENENRRWPHKKWKTTSKEIEKMEDDLKKMEDDLNFFEDNLKEKGKTT